MPASDGIPSPPLIQPEPSQRHEQNPQGDGVDYRPSLLGRPVGSVNGSAVFSDSTASRRSAPPLVPRGRKIGPPLSFVHPTQLGLR